MSDHIVVYLPFENPQYVCQLLNQLSQWQFKLYAPNIKAQDIGNVAIRETAHQPFKEDLAKAKGVICNSGFELISECLHLGIPVLTKPLKGQMEQHSNALALKQLQLATVLHDLDVESIQIWLEKRHNNTPQPLPNIAKFIANWIGERKWLNNEMDFSNIWENTLNNQMVINKNQG